MRFDSPDSEDIEYGWWANEHANCGENVTHESCRDGFTLWENNFWYEGQTCAEADEDTGSWDCN